MPALRRRSGNDDVIEVVENAGEEGVNLAGLAHVVATVEVAGEVETTTSDYAGPRGRLLGDRRPWNGIDSSLSRVTLQELSRRSCRTPATQAGLRYGGFETQTVSSTKEAGRRLRRRN
jgi:hypothetical protein